MEVTVHERRVRPLRRRLAAPGEAGAFEFRFYHRVEGRFAIPEDAVLRSVDVRILAVPGGQVKLSRTINMT